GGASASCGQAALEARPTARPQISGRSCVGTSRISSHSPSASSPTGSHPDDCIKMMYDGAAMTPGVDSKRPAASRLLWVGIFFVLATSIVGCGSHRGTTVASHGRYKVGAPYKIDGVTYVPQEEFNHVETGVASWYGPGFHGHYTANGEVYDQAERTAAHRTLQMPCVVRVTNL